MIWLTGLSYVLIAANILMAIYLILLGIPSSVSPGPTSDKESGDGGDSHSGISHHPSHRQHGRVRNAGDDEDGAR